MNINRLSKLMSLIKDSELESLISLERGSIFSNKKRELLQYIYANDNLNDKDASIMLYQNPESSGYKKLVSRVENQLLNEVLINSLNKVSTNKFQQNRINAYRRFVFIMILGEYGDSELMAYYSERLLSKTMQLDIDDISMLLSDFLKKYYSFNHIDMGKVRKYSELSINYRKRIDLKNEISDAYYDLVRMVTTGKNFSQEIVLQKYSNQIEDFKKLINDDQQRIITQRVFSIEYFFYLLINDHKKLLKSVNESIEYYEKRKEREVFFLFMSKLRKSVALMYLQEYEESRAIMNYCIGLKITEGTLHWNSAYLYSFILEMLTKNYQNASEVLIGIVTSKNLLKLDDMWLQQWRIRSAYIHFLAKIGKVDLESIGKKRVPNFRLGKFLNEVPLYSKDKRGLNISIIIAQFLILLADRKFEKLYDRVDAISKYSYRHLKNDFKLRSNCFIRMLLALVKADYNPIRAERYAEKYIARLKTTEMNLNEYSTEIEIIPYEDLWEIIIEMLSNNSTRKS